MEQFTFIPRNLITLLCLLCIYILIGCKDSIDTPLQINNEGAISVRSDNTCDCKIQVRCAVNRCESLRDDQVEEWFVNLKYFVNANQFAIKYLDSYVNNIGTWYDLDFPMMESSMLSSGNYHKLTAEANHVGDGYTTAIWVSVVLDCNSSDDTWDIHRLFPNYDMGCNYESIHNSTIDQKIVTLNSSCISSSPISSTLDDDEEFYPCDPAAGGGGIGG